MELQVNPSEDEEKIIDHTHGYLALPFDKNQFTDFVVGLLGKPQKLTRDIPGIFEMSLKDIQNIDYLLEQRIRQQNRGDLIELQAQIYYSDNSTVTLKGIQSLETYNEVRAVVSSKIQLSWSFLIQFNDKDAPEKQTVVVTISTMERYIEHFRRYDRVRRLGGIYIEINHTARTWAEDIASMLEHHAKSILKEESKAHQFLRENQELLAGIVGLLFFIFCLFGATIWLNQVTQQQIEVTKEFMRNHSTIEEQVSYLVGYITTNDASRMSLKLTIYILAGMLLSAVSIAWMSSYPITLPPSFLILTRKSQEHKLERLALDNKKLQGFLISTVGSLLISLIGNYIFFLFT